MQAQPWLPNVPLISLPSLVLTGVDLSLPLHILFGHPEHATLKFPSFDFATSLVTVTVSSQVKTRRPARQIMNQARPLNPGDNSERCDEQAGCYRDMSNRSTITAPRSSRATPTGRETHLVARHGNSTTFETSTIRSVEEVTSSARSSRNLGATKKTTIQDHSTAAVPTMIGPSYPWRPEPNSPSVGDDNTDKTDQHNSVPRPPLMGSGNNPNNNEEQAQEQQQQEQQQQQQQQEHNHDGHRPFGGPNRTKRPWEEGGNDGTKKFVYTSLHMLFSSIVAIKLEREFMAKELIGLTNSLVTAPVVSQIPETQVSLPSRSPR